MNNKKITSIILAAMLAITSFAGCVGTETKPDGAVDISEAESALISEMLESGMDESEIAEALSTFESEYYATYVSGNDSTESTSDAETGEITTADGSQSVSGGNSSGGSTRNAAGNNGSTNGTTTANGRVVTPSSQNTNGTSGTTTTRPTSGTSATSQTTTAPTTTTTQATSASGTFKSSVEDELVGLINNLRKAKAVSRQKTFYVPIQMSSSARTRARTRAQEIVSSFSHTSASGQSMADECIYKGGSDAVAINIFTTWKNSASHNSSLCSGAVSNNKSVYYCGIGVWTINGSTYAVFGTSGGASGSGLPSGYTAPEQTTPTTTTTAPTSTTTTATPTETTAPTTTTTTAAPTETTVVTTEATTQAQNSTVDDTGDSGGDG